MNEEAKDLDIPCYISPNGHKFFFGPVNKEIAYKIFLRKSHQVIII